MTEKFNERIINLATIGSDLGSGSGPETEQEQEEKEKVEVKEKKLKYKLKKDEEVSNQEQQIFIPEAEEEEQNQQHINEEQNQDQHINQEQNQDQQQHINEEQNQDHQHINQDQLQIKIAVEQQDQQHNQEHNQQQETQLDPLLSLKVERLPRPSAEGMSGDIVDSVDSEIDFHLSDSDDESLITDSYKPDFNTMFQDLLGMPDIQVVDNTSCFKNQYPDLDLYFKNVLQNDIVPKEEIGYITDENTTYEKLLRAENSSEINIQGTKITDHLSKIFDSIFEYRIQGGYVMIYKKNCESVVKDVVTSELVPNLNYFSWQLNKPIDYNTLKYVIFQNEMQSNLKTDQDMLLEAKNILSLEYMICLQPLAPLQMWNLKRFLMAWCINDKLHNSVRLVKVLISQYQIRGNLPYNQQNGVQPSIVIYPKYGVEPTKTVLREISYLFTFHSQYGEKTGSPTYFIKINNLVYYTNGLIDLKSYYRNVENYSNNSVLRALVFDDRFVRIKGATDMFQNIERV